MQSVQDIRRHPKYINRTEQKGKREDDMTLGREKIHFLNTPTPLERMNRVSEDLGFEFWMKRDDLTNLGTGGNKLRKLEYFLKDALDQHATMLLTVGGAQTNHGRLTAAVAAKYGLKSAIVSVDEYPGELSANLLLDGMMDCHVYLVHQKEGEDSDELLQNAVKQVTAEWESKGESVYYIPMGGSNELGALGYYDCAVELDRQIREQGLKNPHLIVTAGSLGTYTGLAAAIKNEHLSMKLSGISVLPFSGADSAEKRRNGQKDAKAYYERLRACYGLSEDIPEKEFDLITEYDGGAYNNPLKNVREAMYYLARTEGIITDPCYTGKTLAGILAMAKEGRFKGETVIMIHTGGIPGIYTKHHRVEMEKELIDHIHLMNQ